jgi:hypothetical protein
MRTETVESGSGNLPILGHGTRVLRGIFNGASGNSKRDLVLNNVAVVEGFHTNIVSEAKLLQAGVWYSGFDCTLRSGTPEESTVLMKLERKYNLVFMELKPLFSYFHAPISDQPISNLIFPTLKRKVRRLYRLSRDYFKPRSDSAQR